MRRAASPKVVAFEPNAFKGVKQRSELVRAMPRLLAASPPPPKAIQERRHLTGLPALDLQDLLLGVRVLRRSVAEIIVVHLGDPKPRVSEAAHVVVKLISGDAGEFAIARTMLSAEKSRMIRGQR